MANFFDIVVEVLKQDQRFFTEDGELLRNAVYEAAMQMDTALIKALLANETTKDRFFTDVDGVAVFDKVGFGWVINNREFLPDSYTRYKNKIGLVGNNGDFISASNDVELVFPYKDCVLEGGQTREDQKRSEIFYNETLAPDEVDRLLYPKVLTNANRYTADGASAAGSFSANDNLIIKGNNLLAIASLLKNYGGKVKCIYIDPPYFFKENTATDTFKYNSNFHLSTWLVFMKDSLCFPGSGRAFNDTDLITQRIIDSLLLAQIETKGIYDGSILFNGLFRILPTEENCQNTIITDKIDFLIPSGQYIMTFDNKTCSYCDLL